MKSSGESPDQKGQDPTSSSILVEKTAQLLGAVANLPIPENIRGHAYGVPELVRRIHDGSKPCGLTITRQGSGFEGGPIMPVLLIGIPTTDKIDMHFPELGGFQDSTDVASLLRFINAFPHEQLEERFGMWRQTIMVNPGMVSMYTSTAPEYLHASRGGYDREERLSAAVAKANAANGLAFVTIRDDFTPGSINRFYTSWLAPSLECRTDSEVWAYHAMPFQSLDTISAYMDVALTGISQYAQEGIQFGRWEIRNTPEPVRV